MSCLVFGVGVGVHIDFGIVGIIAVIVVVVVIGDGIGIGIPDKITAHISQKRESTKQSYVSFSDNSSLIESFFTIFDNRKLCTCKTEQHVAYGGLSTTKIQSVFFL